MSAALVLALLAAPVGPARPADDWRRLAKPADRTRLRGWRSAWLDGLAAARASDSGAVLREGALLDPDRALADPLPPPGSYRCRTLKLGSQRAEVPGYAALASVACRVGTENGPTFTELAGPQRRVGRLFASDGARGYFLGALLFGDEARPFGYGRDPGRNVAGYVERVGPARWRLVVPRPRYDSLVDVIELTLVS